MGIFMLPRDKLWAAVSCIQLINCSCLRGKIVHEWAVMCKPHPGWCWACKLVQWFLFPCQLTQWFLPFTPVYRQHITFWSGLAQVLCSTPWEEVLRLSIQKLTNPGWFFPSPPEHAWPWEQRPCLDHKHNLTGNGILNNSKIRAPRG